MSFNADSLYKKYAGQSLDYDGVEADRGQCVQWVEYVLTDGQYGYGLPPFYGNAIDWFNNYSGVLAENFDRLTDGTIKKGDIVIFNQNVGSVYGHIDLAMADGNYDYFLGADSNWSGNKTVHLVKHYGRQYIKGVLRRKNMSDTTIADQRLKNEQAIAAAVGFTGNPDDTAGIIGAIDHYKNIANTRDANLHKICAALGFSGNIDDVNGIVAAIQAKSGTYKPYAGPQLFEKE